MLLRKLWLAPALCACGHLCAGELGAPTTAKFIRMVLVGTGTKAVICADKEIAGELANLGVSVEAEAKVAWADQAADVARLAKGRLVICGTKGLLNSGAALAVVAEGGHPVIYVNPKAGAGSGLTLPDNILKIAKVAQ